MAIQFVEHFVKNESPHKILKLHYKTTKILINKQWLQIVLNCGSYRGLFSKNQDASGAWFAEWECGGGALSLSSDLLLISPFKSVKKFSCSKKSIDSSCDNASLSYFHFSSCLFFIHRLMHLTGSRSEKPQSIHFHFGWIYFMSQTFLFASICHLLDRTAQLIRLTTPTPMNCPVLLLNLQICAVIIWMKSSWGQVKVVCDKAVRYD